LPPGAEAEITNFGSGSGLFTTDLKFFRMVAKKVFVNCYNFNPIKKVIFKVPVSDKIIHIETGPELEPE
jgi:hypothetical protein